MFNREFRVQVAKKDSPSTDVDVNEEFLNKLTVATVEIENLIKKAALGVAGYILLDTFRKVVVEKAKCNCSQKLQGL